jgi:hypothetical protein
MNSTVSCYADSGRLREFFGANPGLLADQTDDAPVTTTLFRSVIGPQGVACSNMKRCQSTGSFP